MRIPLEPVDGVTITTLVDNTYDVFMPDQGPAHRRRSDLRDRRLPSSTIVDGLLPDQLVAEHGFSALLEVRKGERTHRFLYDLGVSPNGLIENMDRLSLDPRDVEAIVCSHGHFDHTAGFEGLMRRLGRPALPVVLHPDFWYRRRAALPGGDPVELPTTSRRALEEAGFEIIEARQPSFLFEGSVLVTGEVDRTSVYEPGFPVQDRWQDGAWVPDPLVLDDQAAVINVRDRGLVILTGCGHAGVVNITRYARALTGVDAVHAIVGGFHLNGPTYEPLIPRVCEDLLAMAPRHVVPAHCTGWRAQHAMARAFGEAFIPNAVGTRFEL